MTLDTMSIAVPKRDNPTLTGASGEIVLRQGKAWRQSPAFTATFKASIMGP